MIKKISALLCAAVLIMSLNATVFGASDAKNDILQANGIADKQRTEMKAKFQASQEKWKSLSEGQKEEIYRLKEVSIDIECQIVDKYIELGIIDAESGAAIKAKKQEYKSEIRKTGKIPGFGIKHNGIKQK